MPSSFGSCISRVHDVVGRLGFFKRLSFQARTRLCTDIVFVGLALRTGCLVDAFSPESPVEQFSALLEALQNNRSTRDVASSITHVYEAQSDQSFLVNPTLLHQRIEKIVDCKAGQRHPLTFIRVFPTSQCEIERNIPSRLGDVLDALLQSTVVGSGRASSIILPGGIDMEVAVPLAAIILDYPVGYIPTIPPGIPSPIFLAEVPVRTYECILTLASRPAPSSSPKRERISVMKFSCPQSSEEKERGLLPETIVDALDTLLEERLAMVGDESAALEIVCNTAVFHRLAL